MVFCSVTTVELSSAVPHRRHFTDITTPAITYSTIQSCILIDSQNNLQIALFFFSILALPDLARGLLSTVPAGAWVARR